ncbi:hypothetical protein J2751_001403 [Halorubrum alkaliphilum]|uniref:Uncharacterized protein n=1 Tax=Halorubrum alkaliphilum TaxID=261290 RepID=A0A8T4GH82_9EURY|nr:hypothetical protein [Halorubrum alkaliphilum]MBP1922395.1 hypothetical protein [Halorubrum alkaliphilum]
MIALVDFVTRLLGDVGRFIQIFTDNLLLGPVDPLTAVLAVAGQLILGVAVVVLGYAAVGALLNELGVTLPSLGGRGRRD